MSEFPLFTVTPAPFVRVGMDRDKKVMIKCLVALVCILSGMRIHGPMVAMVAALGMGSAMLFEMGCRRLSGTLRRTPTADAALTGLLVVAMMPATIPWWAVVTATGIAVLIGREIFGGNGGLPFQSACVATAMLLVSWPHLYDMDLQLATLSYPFEGIWPLAAAKAFGAEGASRFALSDLLLGNHVSALGTGCSLAYLVAAGVLVSLRIIRWEIVVGVCLGTLFYGEGFHVADPDLYAGGIFHLFAGSTLLAAVFLATEDSVSPVLPVPMFLYGFGIGFVLVLIRNLGVFHDGAIFAVLLMNLATPLLDRLRPSVLGNKGDHMVRMIAVLALLSAISGGILASVRIATKDQIAFQQVKFEKAPVLKTILPGITNDPVQDKYTIEREEGVLTLYPGIREGGNLVAFETAGKGYAGDVSVMVGIDPETRTLTGIGVTAHSETPGMGAKAKDDPAFVSQFQGKPLGAFQVRNDGGDIDALSGATVTSRAVCDAVTTAARLFEEVESELQTP